MLEEGRQWDKIYKLKTRNKKKSQEFTQIFLSIYSPEFFSQSVALLG
jgi:hypothetical protein